MRARAAGSEIVARGREGSVLGSSTRAQVEVDASAVFASVDTLATLSRTTFGCPPSHSPTRGRCAAPARRIPENAHRGVVLAAGDDLDVLEGGGRMVRALQGFEVGVCWDIGVPELVLDQLLPNDSFRGQTQRFASTDHRRCVPPGGSTSQSSYVMLYVVFDTQKVPDTRRRRLGRNRRMVAAGQCGRVWALLEVSAVRAPLGGPERCFGATDRCREYRGPRLGVQNT